MKRNVISFWDSQIGIVIILYLGWCFFTSFWSEVPILSFIKSSMLSLVVITMMRAGIEWVKMHSWENALNYLAPLAFIFLLSAFLGKGVPDPLAHTKFADGSLHYYKGLVAGSNMFGFMMAVIFPFLLWKTFQAWASRKNHILYFLLLLSTLYFLLISIARSSILMTLLTFSGFILSLKLTKKVSLVIYSLLISICIIIIYPSSLDTIESTAATYIFKNTVSKDVFSTRHNVWNKSYEAAEAGGWTGVGYGVSWGQGDFSFDHGLTSSFYSREKGNSQLSIIEETGIVGFILYATLLSVIFWKLCNIYIATKEYQDRVLVGIISGLFVGMIGMSVFEGWWDAPGGPESSYFWLLVGIIRGLEIVVKGRKTYATSSIETSVREGLANPV